MSYTNKTANYELPQYAPDDKPTYLGDFNQAMLKIDTTMKSINAKSESAQTNASNANATASEALETASSASTLANTANTTAGEAKTMAQNAQTDASSAISAASSASSTAQSASQTANSAKSDAESAKSTAQSALNSSGTNSQNITKMMTWNSLGDIKTNGTGSLNAYFNEGLNLLNIYGRTNGLTGTGTNVKIGSLPENIRPSSTRRINGVAFTYYGTGSTQNVILFDLDILPNGDIVIHDNVTETIYSLRINCMLNTTGWFE